MTRFLISLAALCLFAAAVCAQDNGLAKNLKKAEEKLQPAELSSEQLIALLEDNSFFVRSVAHRHLALRVRESIDLLLAARSDAPPETKARVRSILREHARSLIDERSKQLELEIELWNPRFWSGTNQYIGGIPDESLDSSLRLKSEPDVKLKRIISPLLVAEAKTNTGEVIGQQVWASSRSNPGSLSLYLNRPIRNFDFVNVKVLVVGEAEFSDPKVCPFRAGRHQLYKDVWWVEIERQSGGACLLTVTDLLGRLAELKTPVLLDAKQNKLDRQLLERKTDGRFQCSWELAPGEFIEPAFLQIAEPRTPVWRTFNLAVPCPNKK